MDGVGGKVQFWHFYPKIITYLLHFWADISTEGSMLMMYNFVTNDELLSELVYTTKNKKFMSGHP